MEVTEMKSNIKTWTLTLFVTVFLLILTNGCTPVFWVKKYREMPDVGPLENLELTDRVTIVEKNIDNIGDRLPKLDFWDYPMVVISDYNKGFLTEEDIAYIAYKHPNTICDTKKKLGDWCKDLRFIKLNRTEFNNNKEFIEENDWILEKLIITLDKDGCMYNGTSYPTERVEIMDISGAGDTFVAGFVKEFLDTDDIIKSIQFGNRCSAQVVQKRGVTTIDYENL